MKKFITLLIAGTFLFSCSSSKEMAIKKLDGYTYYGKEGVLVKSAISVDKFAKDFGKGLKSEYTLKANLASICAKAGCFVIVDLPNSTQMRVMFKDHFTIPTDTEIGTEAIFTGTARMDTTSIADLQHYIMDEMEGDDVSEEKKAELKKKHDAITEPEIEPVFIASGILVKN